MKKKDALTLGINAEKKLDLLARCNSLLYDLAPVGYCTLSENGQIREANLTASTLLGLERKVMIDQLIVEFISKIDHDIFYFFKKMLLETGYTHSCELRMLKKNGKPFWGRLEGVCVNTMDGENQREILLVISDITKNIDLREKKFAQEVELRTLHQAINSSAIVAFTDLSGVMTFTNDLFCKVSQYSKEELLGKTHKILQSGHHDKQFYKELWSTISSGNIWTGEIKNKARDGSFYWTLTTIVPSLDQEGKPFQYVSIRMDITEKKKIEDELFKIQMEKQVAIEMIEEKNKFMDIAAHELRTPITALSLFIQSAEKKIKEDIPLTFDFIAKLRRPADRLAKLVTNLLEISRERRGFVSLERTQVDLDQLIFECLEDFKVIAKNINFIFERPPLPISMNIDPLRINQVLTNLLDNAIKYAGERDIEVTLIETSQCAQVSVIDRGYGISKDQQEKIFMAFSRGQNNTDFKASGLGLGLAVCKGIIDLHQGHIGVHSIEGKGSTFYFELPKT